MRANLLFAISLYFMPTICFGQGSDCKKNKMVRIVSALDTSVPVKCQRVQLWYDNGLRSDFSPHSTHTGFNFCKNNSKIATFTFFALGDFDGCKECDCSRIVNGMVRMTPLSGRQKNLRQAEKNFKK